MTPKKEAPGASPPEKKEASSPEWTQAVSAFLKAAGQALNHGALYGPSHKITTQSLNECFARLTPLLEHHPRINLTEVAGELRVDGQPLQNIPPLIKILVQKLQGLHITALSLFRGMSQTEFNRLMHLLITSKASSHPEDFAEVLSRHQLEHVQSERVRYELVTESQTVTDKREAAERAMTATAMQQIIAFLKGEVESSEDLRKDLATLASDAEQLATLIMEAAVVRQRTEGVAEGESLADIVVSCLRRTFEGLVRDPSRRTKKGKVTLKKTMLMLEKKVLDRLHALEQKTDPSLDEAVTSAVEEMVGDLEVEALATEYSRKRQALEKAERRVLNYLEAHGEDPEMASELKNRLEEAGVPAAGWHELVVKSEKGGVIAEVRANPLSLGVLAMLLSELDSMMAGVTDPHAVGAKLVEIGKKAQEASAIVQQHIEQLGQTVREAAEVAEKTREGMTKANMMTLLAEIAQELIQFLSAINCAVSMTLKGYVGALNPEQREVLGVASECGNRLAALLNRLTEIVGLPRGLHPDKERVYGKSADAGLHADGRSALV